MAHTSRYSFSGQARLAQDTGLSRAAVSRMLSGQSSPSFALVLAVTAALEKQLGKRIDPRELLTFSGEYPTASVCALCGCRGCLPDEAYRPDGTLRPEFRRVRPGEWSLPLPRTTSPPGTA